jgi:hypothetical protein
MARSEGAELLHLCALRIVSRFLLDQGSRSVETFPGTSGFDIRFDRLGTTVRGRVKSDPYCGQDPVKIEDRSLPFYRADGGDYALQVIAHHVSKEPGWALHPEIDEVFYYMLAVDHTEDDLARLVEEPDETFFGGIRVPRDELHILPMAQIREWLPDHLEQFPSRPISAGDHSAWYRIVPRTQLARAVPGIVHVGSISPSG